MGSVVVADEASQRAMEVADKRKEEDIIAMSTVVPDPPKVGAVKAAPETG